MMRRPINKTWLSMVICSVLSACGTTGTTSRFVLSLDLPEHEKAAGCVRIASAVMEPDAAILNVVNVKPWGRFETDDLKNLIESLNDTIAPHRTERSARGDTEMEIHLVVRRYIVSTSNTAGAVLACVAWAATSPEGTVIFKEQFYAADAGYLITTIGLVKDSVHHAIVRRIATISLELARGSSSRTQEGRFEKTSILFDESVSRLPRTMISLGDPVRMASPDAAVGVAGLFTPSEVKTIEWGMGEPSEAFDWDGYLKRVYEPQYGERGTGETPR